MLVNRMFVAPAFFAAAAFVFSLATPYPQANAQDGGHSVVVDSRGVSVQAGGLHVEVDGPVLPAPPVIVESHAAPAVPQPVVVQHAAPAIECTPAVIVREFASLSAKRAYRCHGAPIHQVLCVDNPADCCQKFYSVQVCVPACCVGEPRCVARNAGLLGRGHVTYRWDCGFEATITFRVRGGVLIAYR